MLEPWGLDCIWLFISTIQNQNTESWPALSMQLSTHYENVSAYDYIR